MPKREKISKAADKVAGTVAIRTNRVKDRTSIASIKTPVYDVTKRQTRKKNATGSSKGVARKKKA